MPPKKKDPPLPIPRTWLARQGAIQEEVGKSTLLQGRYFRPGTKGHLRTKLRSLGWSDETIHSVMSGLFAPEVRLFDFRTAQQRSEDMGWVYKLQADLSRDLDVEVDTTVEPMWAMELWRSYTMAPWWLIPQREAQGKLVLLIGKKHPSVSKAAVAFVHDIWRNLGDEPLERMPVIRRFNLLAWSSTENIARFGEEAKNTDLAFFYGGIVSEDDLHRALSYLVALSESFPGLTVYEFVDDGYGSANILKAARWAGITTLLGVG